MCCARGPARGAARRGPLPLVDWADEEGARFGRSLLGSSAASRQPRPGRARAAPATRDGRPAAEVLARERRRAGARCSTAASRDGASRAPTSSCTSSRGRCSRRRESRRPRSAAASGSSACRFRARAARPRTPARRRWTRRRDAGLRGRRPRHSRSSEIASEAGGVGTVGSLRLEPGAPTVIPGVAEMLVDLRHPDAGGARGDARGGAPRGRRRRGGERGCEVAEEPVWRIEPIAFDPELVSRGACAPATGSRAATYELPSGALHDAAEVAEARPGGDDLLPLDRRGSATRPAEDTAEADLLGRDRGLRRCSRSSRSLAAARTATATASTVFVGESRLASPRPASSSDGRILTAGNAHATPSARRDALAALLVAARWRSPCALVPTTPRRARRLKANGCPPLPPGSPPRGPRRPGSR